MTAQDAANVPRSVVITSARKHFDVAALLLVGGILAALGAASCGVVPLALFLTSISGAWTSNLKPLELYQPVFAAVSLGFIGYGAWRLYRKPEVA